MFVGQRRAPDQDMWTPGRRGVQTLFIDKKRQTGSTAAITNQSTTTMLIGLKKYVSIPAAEHIQAEVFNLRPVMCSHVQLVMLMC